MIFTTPVLETQRCLLRPLSTGDAGAVFQWAGDSEPFFSRQEIENFMRSPETILAKYDE